jgi:large subunit ribosomal protein L9
MSLIDLILKEEVPKLGEAGDLVRVKPGFARNYLLPQGKAALATKARVKELEHQKRVISEKQAKELKDLEAVKHKIESVVLEFTAQAGEEGKLFGSITAANIAEQLAEKGIEVDRRKLALDEAIKTVGEHAVSLKLRGELAAKVKVVVTAAE